MTTVYYFLVLINALVSFAAAGAVYWKNRHQLVGPLIGLTMFVNGLWLVAFAQYYRELPAEQALWWAKLTLTLSILDQALLFHGLCALIGRPRRFTLLITIFYAAGVIFSLMVWSTDFVVGLKHPPYMHHYISYNRTYYPFLMAYYLCCQLVGAALVAYSAYRAVGYRRTHLVYFFTVWFISFLATNSIILPLEYDINVPPVCFLILPINFALLAYVLTKARLADYNVVIARVILHTVMLLVVAGVSLVFVGGAALLMPDFMNQQQLVFAVALSTIIGAGLTFGLPRFLPRAERLMQERLFSSRAGYLDALSGLIRRLAATENIDEMFATVATTIQSEMQLDRALLFMEDPLSGEYRLRAESGAILTGEAQQALPNQAPLLEWIRQRPTLLVRDELQRQLPPQTMRTLDTDLQRLGVAVCAPLLLDDKLAGILCLGPKANRDMFFISDLNLLNNLATELALVFRYRRVEEEILHKNKLIELGTIAAGVAHEVRNPLASIRTFAQLLPEKADDPDFKNEFSKLVLSDVDRITKVIDSMLAFSRPGQMALGDHPVADLVEEALLLTQARLKGKRIQTAKQFHETPAVRVDRQKILQVLVNLINNATDALPAEGQIRIVTGMRRLDLSGGVNSPQPFAVIEVSDNGVGIPAAVRGRLFDPFFTTKTEGTGLGLSISQKIVRDHGGLITVSSVEGKGSAFQVSLPLA